MICAAVYHSYFNGLHRTHTHTHTVRRLLRERNKIGIRRRASPLPPEQRLIKYAYTHMGEIKCTLRVSREDWTRGGGEGGGRLRRRRDEGITRSDIAVQMSPQDRRRSHLSPATPPENPKRRRRRRR